MLGTSLKKILQKYLCIGHQKEAGMKCIGEDAYIHSGYHGIGDDTPATSTERICTAQPIGIDRMSEFEDQDQ